MRRTLFFALVLAGGCLVSDAWAVRSPEATVEEADEVLREIMAIPMRQIPRRLLAEAQGIAIIPGVIKVGFVGGIRRGRGVVLVRGREGVWGLPQFVILTGGSVGWQVGIQTTDVILVFRTKKSIDGLLNGKLTLGVGGSVAAGPVGRSAEVATDAAFKAEILSYSRSRGIFAGVAIDGSAIEIDGNSHLAFYGSPSNAPPMKVPQSAMQLLNEIFSLTGGAPAIDERSLPVAVDAAMPVRPDDLRQKLAGESTRLSGLLDWRWRQYLALPPEVYAGDQAPPLDALKTALQQFDRVAADVKYRGLTQRPEFQATHQILRQYIDQLSEVSAMPLQLPPPPGAEALSPAR